MEDYQVHGVDSASVIDDTFDPGSSSNLAPVPADGPYEPGLDAVTKAATDVEGRALIVVLNHQEYDTIQAALAQWAASACPPFQYTRLATAHGAGMNASEVRKLGEKLATTFQRQTETNKAVGVLRDASL